jgi:endonuclease/exonuclease/phosphatase family metal-dependent hydrolase
MRKNIDARSAGIRTRSYCLLVLLAAYFSPLAYVLAVDSDSVLLEIGVAPTADAKRSVPEEIKIVSFNIRWRGGEDLDTLIQLLKDDKEIGGAAVIGLQEVDRKKKRTNSINTAKKIADELRMHYAWAAPPPATGKESDEEETGVAILSPFPITDATRIVLPNPGPGGRLRAAIGATIHIGQKRVRVYSIHAEIRMSNEKRIGQLRAVLDDLQSRHAQIKHSVVLGDFNTPTPKDVNATTRLFTESGFKTPFSNDESTWRTFIIELKLDWLWLRGFEVKDYGIDKKVKMSDHWPLWTIVALKDI